MTLSPDQTETAATTFSDLGTLDELHDVHLNLDLYDAKTDDFIESYDAYPF